ncbi:hypothetical protein T484DRAFT_1854456 [Baffinella frigidus]|nr:hypothetical protein T484DRAFT_1854456 [Cryptophyta sp. CCMP2293]
MTGYYSTRLFYNGTASRLNPYILRVIAADPVVRSSLLIAPSRSLSATADRFANFSIQLVDGFGNFRTQGGEQVVIRVESGPRSSLDAISTTDNTDGSYGVLCRFSRAGLYSIALGITDIENALPFSPMSVDVAAGRAVPEMARLDGNPTSQPGIAITLALYLIPPSSLGRKKDVSSSAAALDLAGAYSVSYYREVAGAYQVVVRMDGARLLGSPFALYVAASEVRGDVLVQLSVSSLEEEARYLSGIPGGRPGFAMDVVVVARDVFGNHVNRAGTPFSVSLSPSGAVSAQRGLGNGYTHVQVTPPLAGGYSLEISYRGGYISGSPFSLVSREIGAVWAPQSRAKGGGIEYGTAGVVSTFEIHAADSFGLRLTSGGGFWAVIFAYGMALADATQVDRLDGTYGVSLSATAAGVYSLSVRMGAPGRALHGSPFSVEVFPGGTNPSRTILTGGGLTIATAGEFGSLNILARDQFGNLQSFDPIAMGDWFSVDVAGPVRAGGATSVYGNATFTARHLLMVAGVYSLSVRMTDVQQTHIGASPFLLVVWPADASESACSVFGPGTKRTTAGFIQPLELSIRDIYSNSANLSDATVH